MGNILIFIVLTPLYFILFFFEPNNKGENNLAAKDSQTLLPDTNIGKTCIDCHAVLFEKAIKHTTATGKDCEDCHKKNGKEHPLTGVKAFSLNEKMSVLCLSCHDKIKNNMLSSRNIHQPINDEKSCITCHSPHSSLEKKLLVSKAKELCFSCHNKTITVASKTQTKTLANIEQLNKNSTVFHPPFKKCSSTCHNPHASNSEYLLNITFPSREYSPAYKDSFALCFECHDPELLETRTTKTATSFRNGDQNLHFLHINGEKGRSCSLCHSPHATNNKHLIRDKVKFGDWEFKMTYSVNENGGTCLPACHKEKTYNNQ